MRTYKKIAEIVFTHEYYSDGKLVANDLEFVPSKETEQIIRNYRMLLKLKDDRIEIIQEYDRDEGVEDPFIEVQEELKFSFIIKQKNKNFITYSDIPFLKMGSEILYFTNKKKKGIVEKGGLSINKQVSEKDIYPLLPKAMPLVLKKAGNKFDLSDFIDNKISNYIQKGNIDERDTFLLQQKNGKYTVAQSAKNKIEYVLNKVRTNSGNIGFLDIYINDSVKKMAAKGDLYSYSLVFKPRLTYWQYAVSEKYNSIKKIKIIDDKGKVKFKEKEELVSENGVKTKLFMSNEKLPIQKEQNYVFQLLLTNGSEGSGKLMFEKLPYPKISNIGKLEKDYISKIYIYI